MSDLYARASRFIGIALERPGNADHPLIQWWLSLCGLGLDQHDEVAWCSAFINGMAWDLRLERSKSAAARSWLGVGRVVPFEALQVGDVVIIKRGEGKQPGPEVLDAQGHVALYAGREGKQLLLLGGNQGNQVSVAPFDAGRFLGGRRLA